MMTKEELIESLMVIELAARAQRNALNKNCTHKIVDKILDKFICLVECELTHIRIFADGKE
jgi:hypothetical protein